MASTATIFAPYSSFSRSPAAMVPADPVADGNAVLQADTIAYVTAAEEALQSLETSIPVAGPDEGLDCYG